MDVDGDLEITTTDLQTYLRSLGFTEVPELSTNLEPFDTNGDGALSEYEFVARYCPATILIPVEDNNPCKPNKLDYLFRMWDSDGWETVKKGRRITAADVRHGWKYTYAEELTEQQVEKMIKQGDTNGDGQLTFKEFRRMMKKVDPEMLKVDPLLFPLFIPNLCQATTVIEQ